MFRSAPGVALVCWLLLFAASAPAAAPPPRPPSAEELAGLIRRLGAEEFERREAATSGLLRLGRAALPTLRRGVTSGDAEVRQRCKDLIARIDTYRISLEAKGAVFQTEGDDPDGAVIEAHLHSKKFGDKDLGRLEGMHRLRCLDLKGSAVTDAGLAKLARFAELAELDLRDTGITGSGFVHLKGLRALNHLLLDRAPIADKSLAHLAALPLPYLLSLKQTPVTDEGLALLRESRVWSLALGRTRITDAGLVHVRRMKNLKFLYLEGTALTACGMKHLEGHEDLRQVNAPNSVGKATLDTLQSKLPKYGDWEW